jgi:GDP-L-fucose synthase
MKKTFTHLNKKVYIAGHSGLAGSAIERRLKKENCHILKATHSELDLTIQKDVNEWFEANKPDAVYLAAATAGGIHANYERPAEFIYNNLVIQNNIIHASHLNKVKKLCFLGSSCIYPRLAEQPMKEDALLTGPLDKHNIWYAVAKIAGLMLVDGYSKQYGCKFISVMPANLYGPGDKYTEENSHVVAALIKRFHEAKEIGAKQVEIWGTGKAMREFMHCDDMADACFYLMEYYDSPDLVNVGTGEDVSIKDLAYLIKDVINFNGKLVFDTSKPDGMPRKVVDTKKLNDLGWTSSINLKEGLSQTYSLYKELLLK